MEKFIELAGGPDKKFVIVPTAGGNRRPDGTLHRLQGGRRSSRHGSSAA